MTRDTKFTPRSLSSSEYVFALFEPQDHVALLLLFRGRGRTTQRITTAETIAQPQTQSWLREQNRAGADAFIGMNPIKEGAHGRTRDSIKEIRHVYLDLDEKGDESLNAVRNSHSVPTPNFVLDTSPGKHQVVWRIEGVDQCSAEPMLHSLANQFGGDVAATDSTRVFRLPGLINRKYSPGEFLVQVSQESDRTYHYRDFALDEDSPESPRHVGDTSIASRRIRPGHKSQSERDWAFALRALESAAIIPKR